MSWVWLWCTGVCLGSNVRAVTLAPGDPKNIPAGHWSTEFGLPTDVPPIASFPQRTLHLQKPWFKIKYHFVTSVATSIIDHTVIDRVQFTSLTTSSTRYILYTLTQEMHYSKNTFLLLYSTCDNNFQLKKKSKFQEILTGYV
mgnify:CR=1 FL=1